MMREFRPKRIIEIGSGFSSALMLDVNEKHFNNLIDLTFIEPYPDRLNKLVKPNDKANIIPQKLQDVDFNIFTKLEENDIFFIDSSHVSKAGSDVNSIIFNVLPLLKKGVLIHFHDIFYPFEYPEKWYKEGRYWNEAYILRAFLQFNSVFKIIYWLDWLKKGGQNGGSIWLIKRI